MSILWCGGEDVDFPSGSAPSVDTNTARRRTLYSRCAVYTTSTTSPLKSLAFSGGAVTSAWLAFEWFTSTLSTSSRVAGLGRSGASAGALFVGTSSASATKLALWKWDGATFTQLATESGTSLTSSTLVRVDVQIVSYGSSATVRVYLGGVLLITYTGDVTVSGVSNLDSVWILGTSSIWPVSEVIVADEDTRLLSLCSLYPTRAGDSTLWGQSTAGASGYLDIAENAINDATVWFTDTIGQDAEVGLSAPPAGSFDVRAVKLAARCSKTAGATAGSVSLGTNGGRQFILGGGALDGTTAGTTSANTKYVRKITPSETAAAMGLVLLASSTSSVASKAVIYADSSGVPGALLATSAEVIGVIAGQYVVYTFASPPTLSAGTSYWIGIHVSGAIGYYYLTSAAPAYSASDTYSDGAANPFGTPTVLANCPSVCALKAGEGLESPMPSAIALSTSWETKERYLTINPRTGLAFTAQELTGLQINFRSAT